MTLDSIAAIAYGLLTLVGGIMGYRQAKSKLSLISGGISGSLLMLCGVLSEQGMTWATGVAIAITGVLIAIFSRRLAKTRKFMPAGLMIIAGIAALLAMAL